MTAVLNTLQRMNFPSSDSLAEDSFPYGAESPKESATYSEMLMNSMGKLSVGAYVSSDNLSVYSNMGSPRSPRSMTPSPNSSMSNLFGLKQVFNTFEKNIALNANTKSTDCLTALDLDNRMPLNNDNHDNNNTDNVSMLKKFMNTLEKFLDVDGEVGEDTSHFIIC